MYEALELIVNKLLISQQEVGRLKERLRVLGDDEADEQPIGKKCEVAGQLAEVTQAVDQLSGELGEAFGCLQGEKGGEGNEEVVSQGAENEGIKWRGPLGNLLTIRKSTLAKEVLDYALRVTDEAFVDADGKPNSAKVGEKVKRMEHAMTLKFGGLWIAWIVQGGALARGEEGALLSESWTSDLVEADIDVAGKNYRIALRNGAPADSNNKRNRIDQNPTNRT